MIFVWFVYGLAFFVLGFAIIVYPKRGSRFRLARHIWLIGMFGIVHGINEWLDMFHAIGGPIPLVLVDWLRMVTLAGSFLFLLQFGVTVLSLDAGVRRLLRLSPLILTGAWIVVVWTAPPQDRLLMGDIWGRYLLCAPGAFLTAWSLFLQTPSFKSMRLSSVVRNLTIAAATFLIYGVVAGLWVRKADFFPASVLNYDAFQMATGFPIQVLRAVCAVVAAWSIIRVLDVFRWETQESLRISELRCATIASAMPVFLFMADRDLMVTFIEGKGLETLGLDPVQTRRRRVADIFPSSGEFVENCRRALSGQESMAVVSVAGVFFDVYFCALRDSGGEVSHVVGVGLDISVQVKAREELEEYRRRMEKHARDAEVGTLSAMMGRQIAEPLSVAELTFERAAAEMQEGEVSEVARRSVGKGLAELSKAREMLTRFLSIAHPGLTVAEQLVPLYQIARRTVGVFAESARRKGLTIAIKEMDVVPLMAISLREVEQIFYQLIQSAVEASRSDGEQRLTITGSASDGQIELVFSSSCGGASPQPFCSPSPSDPKEIDGMGLGLAVVRQIVASHRGEIIMESQPDGGTVFRVRLPAACAH